MSFSAAPWSITATPSGKPKVVDAHGFSVCNLGGGSYVQNSIDARLIAAAPELLDALEALLEMGHAKAGDIARKAIAKATGQ